MESGKCKMENDSLSFILIFHFSALGVDVVGVAKPEGPSHKCTDPTVPCDASRGDKGNAQKHLLIPTNVVQRVSSQPKKSESFQRKDSEN